MTSRLIRSCVVFAFVCAALIGCSSKEADSKTAQIEGDPPAFDLNEEDAGGHPTEGPHGGHLLELGNEEYHVELLHSEDTNTVTVHLLDSAAKEPVSVPLTELKLQMFEDGDFVDYTLAAVQQDGSDGASQFEIVDAKLCEAICHGEVRGRLHVTIAGKDFTGVLEHAPH